MSAHKPYRPVVSRVPLKDRLVRPFVAFAHGEANSGMLLVALAVVALLWANLGPAGHYDQFWNMPVSLGIGSAQSHLTLRHWINDGLMALFFLLVGLEIKREFTIGELSERRNAILPIVAALGGMLVPAGIFLLLNLHTGDLRGTGVPMATDIAFSLGVLALLGSRVPAGLKVFLAAIAIVDDLGAVLVIAFFYSKGIQPSMLMAVAGCLGALVMMNRLGVRSSLAYFAAGIPMWAFMLASGVHATVAGVLLAMTIPIRTYLDPVEFTSDAREALTAFEECKIRRDPRLMTEERQMAVRELELACERVQMPLERMEDALSPWVNFLIVPIFALANAGVNLSGGGQATSWIGAGIFFGLVLGKPLGILLATYIATRKWSSLPEGVTWHHVAGVSMLAGIGFTMSLFIAELAFGPAPEHDIAKLATLVASVVAGVVGYGWLRFKGAVPARSEAPPTASA